MLMAASLVLPCALAFTAELTHHRLTAMTDEQAAPWRGYLERSAEHARQDEATLRAELTTVDRQPVAAPKGGDFRLSDDTDRSWYAGDEAARLADAVISFQTPSGGWSKHLGYAKGPRTPGMQWTSQSEPGESPHYQATFDNGATVTEIAFLASVWEATDRPDCREAVLRGLSFILDAQYPNGGWPQVYPLEGGYHDCITFNDDAMTGVLELLLAMTDGAPRFRCVDDVLSQRAAAALDAGIATTLALQVEIDGRATGWCGQYDPLTCAPAAARAYEPAALASIETSHVIRFLMGLPAPRPDVVRAIEDGLAWLDAAAVKGVAKVKRGGRTIYVADGSAADPLWARFYDLDLGRPLFPGKDGVIYSSFEEMAMVNDKLGYDYYSTRPGSVLRTGQKKWRKRLAESR